MDQYVVEEQKTFVALRWRSRLPRAPLFDRTPFSYLLAYKIYGVMLRLGGGKFLLSHEFVPQRQGTLADMQLRLWMAVARDAA